MKSSYSSIFEKYLAENLFLSSPKELYEPVNYILTMGGKRLRPILALMGCGLFDDRVEKAVPAAMAVEVFHNFTLLHDDIMDAAPIRRGNPTVHKKYGLNAGVLSGDVMLIHAYDFLLRIENKSLVPEVFSIFNKMAIEVCQGQQYDMNFETSAAVSIPDYLRMIELKTAVLLASAFKIGALIGGASAIDADHLSEFGRNMGIAFQLQDDVLDTYGDPEKFGKKVGGDIVQNKKSYLVLKALEIGGATDRSSLSQLMSSSTGDEAVKIAAVKSIFDRLEVRRLTEDLMNEYAETAYKSLQTMEISAMKKLELKKWASGLLTRES